jgi:hypothetical protein
METESKNEAVVNSAREIERIRIKLSTLDLVLAVAHEAVEPFEWDIRERGLQLRR